MTSHIEIYIGVPMEYDSERLAFKAIVAMVTAMNKDAIIIANVHIGQTQVDLIVAFEKNTHVIEVKKATTPITGGATGIWSQKTSTASWAPIRNYYDQAMKAGYAVKDKLSDFFGRKIHYPRAMLLFAPQLHPASHIPPTDFKVAMVSLNMLTQLDNTPPSGRLQFTRLEKIYNLSQLSACIHLRRRI